MSFHLQHLMPVTALNRHIGYDAAVAIAKYAHQQGCNLREEALGKRGIRPEDFDAWVCADELT